MGLVCIGVIVIIVIILIFRVFGVTFSGALLFCNGDGKPNRRLFTGTFGHTHTTLTLGEFVRVGVGVVVVFISQQP